jgi:AraC-like DNA-binding protein
MAHRGGNLRIERFVRLYREAIANSRPFTAQQLAQESGFRSYSTFGTAFKQRMGQNVSSWMHEATK